ncbi:MAG: hypothetical protein GXX10_07655 [Clostridiaceae bacterium]|nr:hypothetical protein [Clostridiaceae bacterium]
MNSISAVCGLLSGKVNFKKKDVIAIYLFGNLVCVALMGFIKSLAGIILPVLLFFVIGLINPWLQKYWGDEISSSLMFAFAAVPIGYLSDNWNVFYAFKIPSFIYAVLLFIFIASLKIRNNNEKSYAETQN